MTLNAMISERLLAVGLDPEETERVVRGGSWRQPRLFQRTTSRDGLPPETRSPEVGFRCAR